MLAIQKLLTALGSAHAVSLWMASVGVATALFAAMAPSSLFTLDDCALYAKDVFGGFDVECQGGCSGSPTPGCRLIRLSGTEPVTGLPIRYDGCFCVANLAANDRRGFLETFNEVKTLICVTFTCTSTCPALGHSGASNFELACICPL